MNTIPVNYNQAYELKQKYFPQLSDQEAAENLKALTSTDDAEYDYSSLYNTNPLIKGRAAINRAISSGYESTVEPLITAALGDTAAGRIANKIGRGIAEGLPELGAIIATHGKGAGKATRFLGDLAAGGSAFAQRYAETGDPTSSTVAALSTGLTPAVYAGASKAVGKLPSLATSPTASTVTSGALTSLATTTPDIAYSPRAVSAPSSSLIPVRTYEQNVDILDVPEAAERLSEFAKSPEDVTAVAIGSIVPDVLVGAQARSRLKTEKLNDLARANIESATSETKNYREYLNENNIPTPKFATELDLNNAYTRLITEGGQSQVDIIKQLFNNVNPSKLTKEEQAFKTRLNENKLNPDDITYITRPVDTIENNFSQKILSDLDRVISDTELTSYEPKKENWFSQKVSGALRLLSNAHQATEAIPAAREVIETYANQRINADNNVRSVMEKLGQDENNTRTTTDSYNNITNIVKRLNNDSSFNKTIGDFMYNLNKELYTETVNPETGELIRTRKTMFNDMPSLSTEDIIRMSGNSLSTNEATFIKRLISTPLENAKNIFDANSTVAQVATAEQLLGSFPQIKDRASALRLSEDLYKQARSEVFTALRTDSIQHNRQGSAQAVANLTKYIEDYLYQNVADKSVIHNQAEALAQTIFSSEKALAKSYMYNSMLGYSSMSRRGEKYGLAYNDNSGSPIYEGFSDKKAWEKRLNELKKDNSIEPTSIKEIDNTAIDYTNYDHLSDIQAENFRREINSIRSELRDYLANTNVDLKQIDPDKILSSIADRTENYFKEAQGLISRSNLELRQSLRRKLVAGAKGSDIVNNAIEAAQSAARRASYIADNAKIDYLSRDKTITDNPAIKDYLDEKRRYMLNNELSEWAPARSLATMYFLVGSSSYILANAFQIPTLGTSLWRSATGRSLADFGKSVKQAFSVVKDFNSPVTRTLSKQSKELLPYLKSLEEAKVFDQHFTDEITALRNLEQGLDDIENKPTIQKLINKGLYDTTDWLTQIITAVETNNRKLAATAYLVSENNYKPLSTRSKRDVQIVLNNAAKFSRDVNFSGGRAQRPLAIQRLGTGFLHGAGLTGMTLANYGLNLATLIGKQIQQAVPGLLDKRAIASKSYKEKLDRTGIFKTLAILGALSGVKNLPGMNLFNSIGQAIGGENYRPSEWIPQQAGNLIEEVLNVLDKDEENSSDESKQYKQQLRNKLVDILQFGLPAAANIHLPNLSSPDILPINALDNPTLLEMMGAAGQAGEKIVNLYKGLRTQDKDLIKRSLPTAFNQLTNTATLATQGTLLNTKEEAITSPSFDRTALETVSPLFGGIPLREAKGREQMWKSSRISREASAARTEFMHLAASAVNDPKRLRQIYDSGVRNGVIAEDETAFAEAVGERLAKRGEKYIDKPNPVIRTAIEEAMARYGQNPKYLSQLTKIEKAIEVAVKMGSPIALERLFDRLEKVDLEKSYWIERGVSPDIIDAFRAENLPISETNLRSFLPAK